MELRKDNVALVVIDMQNGFCRPEGSCAKVGLPVEALAPSITPCAELIAAAREATLPIIYTRYVFQSDYSDGGILIKHLLPALAEVEGLKAGTWDIEILDELSPAEGDTVIDKNRPSAFYAPEFEAVLKERGITQLVVCGVTTNCCVETTARDASQRDYETFVVRDAVAEYDQDRHDNALISLEMLFAGVVCKDDVLAAWAEA